MAENPFWRYLNSPDAEQWFPLFHLAYYLPIKIGGDRYWLPILVNCLGTGINACLVCFFYRRHLTEGTAFVLSLVYSGLVVHDAVICHAYNLCYLLAFGFFMGALLLTDAYLTAPSRSKLAGVGVCALLAVLSHSFAIMSLAVIFLYACLVRRKAKGKVWPLALVMALVYLIFGAGYTAYGGIGIATSHRQVLQLPGPGYLLYLLYGGLIFPFHFLLGNFDTFRILVIMPLARLLGPTDYWKPALTALLIQAVLLPLIFSKGDSRTKRLAFWVISMNLLFFFLVGLARYQIDILQSGALRYGVFTLMGALLLLGLAWETLNRWWPRRKWLRLLPALMLAWIIAAQVNAHRIHRSFYLNMSRITYNAYLNLEPPLAPEADSQLFCPESHSFLTRSRALKIKRFLKGLPQEK